MPASLDLIGRGWAYPLGVDARGRHRACRRRRGDPPGDLADRPDPARRRGDAAVFGCRIWELLFAPNNSSTSTLPAATLERSSAGGSPASRWTTSAHPPTRQPGGRGGRGRLHDPVHPRPAQPRLPVLPDPRRPAAAAAKVAETAAAMAEPGNVPDKAPVHVGSAPAPTATGRAPSPTSRSARSSAGPKEASR